MEKKLRAKLEEELNILRHGEENSSSNVRENGENTEQLRQKLSLFEEKVCHLIWVVLHFYHGILFTQVIRLESERTQWEQRYLEESAMRQVAIDAASIPKDAKIAVLEKSTAESEKMMAEARSDKLKQTAEIHQTQKRMTDMDYQIKALETELAERDSIIKILQKSAYHGATGENVLSIPIQDPTSTSTTSPLMFPPAHSSQLSSPASLSRQQATGVAEFFEGISRDMSSTTRGPLGKLRGETKVS